MDYLQGDLEILLKRRLPPPQRFRAAGDNQGQEITMSTGNYELGAFDRAIQQAIAPSATPLPSTATTSHSAKGQKQ